ncbi:hypothetical protein BHE74_00046715, partial [Ensete ventricosum]
MGKKAKWFGAVKKVFSPESKEKKEERLKKKLGDGTSKHPDPCPADSLECTAREAVPPPPLPHPDEDKVVEIETEQSKLACSVATPATVEPVVTSAEAAREVISLTTRTKFPGKSREEIAAIKIQTAFRGHLWKSSSKSVNPMFMDPNNLQWGWSWLERWMAARPWETRTTTDRELNNDRASVKSTMQSDGGGEILKAYANRGNNPEKPSPAVQKLSRPASRQSPSTPPNKAPWSMGKIKSASPKCSWVPLEDDSRSIVSMQSERSRRHSLATASVRDDESLAGSASVPSYMAPTESARAKSRFQSLSNDNNIDSPDKTSASSVKKRLSFPTGDKFSPASPAPMRRNSGPPKVDMASVKDVALARGLLGTESEFGRMGDDPELGLGGRLLEWWSPGREEIPQLGSAADSCTKAGSGAFIVSDVDHSYLATLLLLWPTMPSYPSTTLVVPVVRRAFVG